MLVNSASESLDAQLIEEPVVWHAPQLAAKSSKPSTAPGVPSSDAAGLLPASVGARMEKVADWSTRTEIELSVAFRLEARTTHLTPSHTATSRSSGTTPSGKAPASNRNDTVTCRLNRLPSGPRLIADTRVLPKGAASGAATSLALRPKMGLPPEPVGVISVPAAISSSSLPSGVFNLVAASTRPDSSRLSSPVKPVRRAAA
jgi:hypothetical protein